MESGWNQVEGKDACGDPWLIQCEHNSQDPKCCTKVIGGDGMRNFDTFTLNCLELCTAKSPVCFSSVSGRSGLE